MKPIELMVRIEINGKVQAELHEMVASVIERLMHYDEEGDWSSK